MTALAEQPISGPLSSIIKATQRLNPCMEIDVDVLAVTRAAVASTQADWAAGVLTSTGADTNGLLRLSPPTGVSLFSQLNAVTVNHFLQDSSNGIEEYAIDFFPNPSILQGVAFTLSSLDLYIGGAQNLKGFYRITVGYYDENWILRLMGDPVDILSGDVAALVGNGGVYTIDFIARGHLYGFPSGMQNTTTGSGYDGTNIRTAHVDNKNVSHLLDVPRGLSISIRPSGANATSAYIGCVANATAAQFNTASFWRVAANRNCGPYNPVNQPYSGATTDHNPDNYLVTGAVPNFGAIAVTNGSWGIARRIPTAQRAQNPLYTWEQPYHNLKVVGYPSTGTAVNVLDMGAVPTNPVELRLDDIQQAGTSLAYVLKGSNISAAGAWTAITANTDGSVLTGADLYRWYQLTTTFLPGPTGATKYASPALQAWSMIERVALSTYRYLKDFDSTTVADPVTAQSSIGELQVPVMNGGRQDFRDLAAQLGSNYAPSSLEAHVYARNTRSGTRYFLNLYRLENRDPQFGVEEMTFVSGMDRLTPLIPAATETFRYPPGSGQVAITNVTNVGAVYTITVAGTPFTLHALANMRMHGVTGVSANQDFGIIDNPTTSQFTINVASGPIPAIGDTFEIHSDVTTRVAAPYVGQNFGLIYKDILAVQAAVPARYRGRLPGDALGKVYAADGVTERLGTYTLPAAGVKGLNVLQDVALHCGGFPAWDKGQIQFVDFYGPKDSVMTWGDREIVSLETPVGADRRMPSVKVKYGFQQETQAFLNEATYDDNDTLLGWGRSNLFDIFELPDEFCKWNTVTEAQFVANMLQKAWKSGVRLWKVKTVLSYPWLPQGAAVTILTDQYTDRRLSFSADGLTDLGIPIAGRTSSIAVIVGKNLWGNEFVVGVRGLDQITSAPVARTGTVATPMVGTQAPVAIITPLNTEGTDAIWNFTFSATPGSGGGGANLTYTIKEKSGIATDTTLSSGNATALPLVSFGVARDARVTAFLRFTVTDTLTGLSSTATWTIPSQRLEIDGTNRFKRANPFDDTYYGHVSTTSDGKTLHSGAVDSRGSAVNTHFRNAVDTADNVVDSATKRVIPFSILRASDGGLLTTVDYNATIGDAQAATVAKRHGIWFSEVFDQKPSLQGYAGTYFNAGTLVNTSGVSAVGTNVYQMTSREEWTYPYFIPFNPSKLYRLRVRYRCTVDAGTVNTRGVYAGLFTYDATGAVTNTSGGQETVAIEGITPTVAQGWREETCWVQGASLASGPDGGHSSNPAAPKSLKVNTSKVKPFFYFNAPFGGTTDGTYQFDYFTIEELDDDASARVYNGFDTSSSLLGGVQQYDNPGANTLNKKPLKGRQSAAGYDTQAITFPVAFQNPPAMRFSRGANTITNQPDSTKWSTPASFVAGQAQIEDVRAAALTATGFTQVAQLVQTSGGTARVGEFTTGNSLTAAGSLTSFALANCPSANGHYTVRYTWSVTTTSLKPGFSRTATIVVTINKRAGGSGGASTELDRQTYSVTDPDGSGPYTNSSGGPQATDINATLGNTDWLEVKITSFTHSGAILGTDSCAVHGCNITDDGAGKDGESHTNGGTTITTTMTPTHASDSVIWEAASWQ